MLKTLAALLLVALASWSAPVAAGDDDETVLRHFKTVLWPQAYREQDTELLDRLLHDSFQMIDAEGNVSRKADELDYVANNPWTASNFVYTIERLDIYQGRFAIIAGTGRTDTYTYKSSNYLVKEGDTWRAVSSHVSGVSSRDAAASNSD